MATETQEESVKEPRSRVARAGRKRQAETPVTPRQRRSGWGEEKPARRRRRAAAAAPPSSAERKSSGVGALFRLTRASVLRAAEQGMAAAQVLGTLESAARGGVPDNVARQVRDWMKAVRTIRIAPAVLVDCPDAETAGRIQSLAGAHVTAVTPTLLRLEADPRTRAAVVKRLREKGIFVAADGDVRAAAPAAATGGRRGRR